MKKSKDAPAKKTSASTQTDVKKNIEGIHCAFDEMVPVSALKPHPKNPNKHSKEQIALLAKIIKAQGWRSPIVVSRLSGFIVAGHGRYQAAQQLGLESVPVNLQNFDSAWQEQEHLIADNRIAELADMDNSELAALINELKETGSDLELAGFSEGSVEELLASLNNGAARRGNERPVLQNGRFILVYRNESEKQYWMTKLDMKVEKVVNLPPELS